MDESICYLTRADRLIMRDSFRPELNFKRNQGLDVEPYVEALIRQLAESHSQAAIAQVLNERGLLRNGKDTWQQFHISRFFKKHGITPICKWPSRRNER